jgi:hypothetical protein
MLLGPAEPGRLSQVKRGDAWVSGHQAKKEARVGRAESTSQAFSQQLNEADGEAVVLLEVRRSCLASLGHRNIQEHPLISTYCHNMFEGILLAVGHNIAIESHALVESGRER